MHNIQLVSTEHASFAFDLVYLVRVVLSCSSCCLAIFCECLCFVAPFCFDMFPPHYVLVYVCSILMQFVRFGSVGCSFSLISLFKRLFIYADCSNLQFGDLQLQRLECLRV